MIRLNGASTINLNIGVTEENLISKNELRLHPNPVKGNVLNIKLSNQVNRIII